MVNFSSSVKTKLDAVSKIISSNFSAIISSLTSSFAFGLSSETHLKKLLTAFSFKIGRI